MCLVTVTMELLIDKVIIRNDVTLYVSFKFVDEIDICI